MNIVPVKKTCEIINGFAFESEHFNTQGKGLPVVRIRDVVRGFSKTFYSGDYDEAYEVNHGDLLIGMDGEFNIAEWRGGLALLNQRVCKIVAKPGVADSSFLKYRLGLLIKEIEDRTPFVTVKHLSSDNLKTSEIELPHIDEQKRIAAILDKADRLRRQRRFAQTLSDSFLQSVFIKMFGELLINDLKWPETTIESVAIKVTDGEHATPIRIAKGIKLLSARNIKNGYIDLNAGLDFISEVEHLRIKKRCNPEFDDVLLSCSGTVGRASTVDIREPFSLVRSVALIKPDKTKILPKYLEHYLRSNYAQRLISISANQSSQANIFIEPIKNLTVLLPPLPLQEKFAAIVQKFERIRRQQREATRQAEHLFHTLLHRAFNEAHNV